MKDTPIERKRLYQAILGVYQGNKKLTARECAVELKNKGVCKYGLRGETHPRITELCTLGKLEPVGSKFDVTTRKTVTVYKEVENG